MSKGLEALEQLSKLAFVYGGVEQYRLIEKELKALEILKKKMVDIDCLIYCFPYDGCKDTNGLIEYNRTCPSRINEDELTQEEYDLLKEVLLWAKD